ncbi:MAG: S8 family peptidase, partial [Aquificaceae bacterium]|nr:S8 family peptidase [Aquificaceae bacterium]
NGVDEDNNGYVDDCFGWNFASNNNNPMDDDSDGHGTHVAGIIGAVGNNGIGVSGVNWGVKIMPVKFLDAQGYGTVEQAVRAIRYAVDMGAKVINASYAYPSGCFSVSPSITERNILEYAKSRGVIVVSASGNYGCNNDNTPFYPASHRLDNVLSVSASNSIGGLPSWSNYGLRSVHLAAPGVKIYSALPSNQYGFLSGTSMASPFVSGAVAMLFSCRPELSYLQIREILLSTAMALEDLRRTTISGGMLRLDRALQSPPVPAKPTLISISHSSGSITLTFQDNSYMEEGFVVQRGLSETNLIDIASLSSRQDSYDTLTFTDSQIQAGNTYYYRVCSYIGSNRSCSHTLHYTVASSQQPQNNTGSSSGGGKGGCNTGTASHFLITVFYVLFAIVFRRFFLSKGSNSSKRS